MTEADQNTLLEIYKLHADLADRVSQRREGANRLFVSMHTALVVFLAALLRFGFGEAPSLLVLGGVGGIGIILVVAWVIGIRSYKQLNREKFRVLQDLERQLPFQFFINEWDPKEGVGVKSNRYWKLTNVETLVPIAFGMLYVGLIGYAFCETLNLAVWLTEVRCDRIPRFQQRGGFCNNKALFNKAAGDLTPIPSCAAILPTIKHNGDVTSIAVAPCTRQEE